MKIRIRALVGVVMTALVLFVACRRGPCTLAVTPATDQEVSASVADVDEIAVEFKDGTTQADIQSLAVRTDLALHWNSPFSAATDHLMVAHVRRENMAAALKALQQDPHVEIAEPNYLFQGLWDPNEIVTLDQMVGASHSARPNDPLYKYQWHMHKIDVEKAWPLTQGKGVVVAVIDTGVAYEDYGSFHQVEDLKQTRFVKGWNFVNNTEHANDDHAHGTHVAGTIAQSTNNGVGVVGVAPEAIIMPIKVLSARGSGRLSDIAEGIRFAADKGAKVINMSLGGPMASGILESAIKHAARKGVIIVCAAGNSNSENVSYPARYPQCIAVSATRFDDQLTFYSNRGKRIDIAAPGGDMNVDQNGDGMKDGVLQNTIGIMDPTTESYALFQGTSMAAPHVAGAAALLVAQGITKPDAVKARLQQTARKEGLELERGYGGGVLDVGRATVKTAVVDPVTRLALGVLLLLGLLRMAGGRPRHIVLTLLGLLMGSAGFFFLPSLGVAAPDMMVQAVPNWDLAIAGVNAHANVLFWSALIPFAIALTAVRSRRSQAFALGLSLGFAAFLLHQIVGQNADIQGVPGWLLPKAWLLLNVAVCGFLAYVLTFQPQRWTSQAETKREGAESNVMEPVLQN